MARLADTIVVCPGCGVDVRVEIIAREFGAVDGSFQVGLRPRFVHECPSGPGDGERFVA